jgi:hypothetical protein
MGSHFSADTMVGFPFVYSLSPDSYWQLLISQNPDNEASLQWGHYFLVGIGLSGILWGVAGGAFFVCNMEYQLFLFIWEE